MLSSLIRDIEQKKAQLELLCPLSGAALAQLQKYYDVELTYTSNAIGGNTLTHRETAEVIEHGITVGGKSLREHLEAVDHYEALQWTRNLAARTTAIGEDTVCELHRRIVARSPPTIAGIYSPHPRRVAGSPVIFPNPIKIPGLMAEFGVWLSQAPSTPEKRVRSTFSAHCNSSVQRWQRSHCASVDEPGAYSRGLFAVRPEDRTPYLDALERGSLSDDLQPFRSFMYERLDATLSEYLSALEEAPCQPGRNH